MLQTMEGYAISSAVLRRPDLYSGFVIDASRPAVRDGSRQPSVPVQLNAAVPGDTVEISEEGLFLAQAAQADAKQSSESGTSAKPSGEADAGTEENSETDSGEGPQEPTIDKEATLSDEQRQEVAAMKQRDREVKSHEQAHIAAGAGVVKGGAQYAYRKGPDGVNYAVGGEVAIDASKEKTPQATIAKMAKVRAAALAPADPSSQDRKVAAQAQATESSARAELFRTAAEGLKVMGKSTKMEPSMDKTDENQPVEQSGQNKQASAPVSNLVDVFA